MMWVNLLQDTLASLSLSTERPSDSLLKRRPYGRNRSLVSHVMFVNIVGHSAYQLVVLFALLFAGDEWLLFCSTLIFETTFVVYF
jgi:Ca2+ transporting ATPase